MGPYGYEASRRIPAESPSVAPAGGMMAVCAAPGCPGGGMGPTRGLIGCRSGVLYAWQGEGRCASPEHCLHAGKHRP